MGVRPVGVSIGSLSKFFPQHEVQPGHAQQLATAAVVPERACLTEQTGEGCFGDRRAVGVRQARIGGASLIVESLDLGACRLTPAHGQLDVFPCKSKLACLQVGDATLRDRGHGPACLRHHAHDGRAQDHGYDWQSTDGAGVSCTRDKHVVRCTRAVLAAGARWPIVVRSTRQTTPAILATHAVASVTGDVLDPDRSDTVRRVSLPGSPSSSFVPSSVTIGGRAGLPEHLKRARAPWPGPPASECSDRWRLSHLCRVLRLTLYWWASSVIE